MLLVKEKLQSAGLRLTAFGVTGLSDDEAVSRRTFEWCQTMGIEVINTEAREDTFDTLEKLAAEYRIKIGLHNHPKPSYYWNPDTVLKAIEGRSPWLGACADTGHWLRSDLDPVECLQKLEGRIVSFHFKDLNGRGRGAHDVPWGTGVANVAGLLAEMKRQGFHGPISIEYEHNWLESLPEIAQCVVNFHRMTQQLIKQPAAAAPEASEDSSRPVRSPGAAFSPPRAQTRDRDASVQFSCRSPAFCCSCGWRLRSPASRGLRRPTPTEVPPNPSRPRRFMVRAYARPTGSPPPGSRRDSMYPRAFKWSWSPANRTLPNRSIWPSTIVADCGSLARWNIPMRRRTEPRPGIP